MRACRRNWTARREENRGSEDSSAAPFLQRACAESLILARLFVQHITGLSSWMYIQGFIFVCVCVRVDLYVYK